jgi:hypothetical protein
MDTIRDETTAGRDALDKAAETARTAADASADLARQGAGQARSFAEGVAQTGQAHLEQAAGVAQEAAERVTDGMAKGMDVWSNRTQEAAQRSRQGAQAMAEYNSVVARGLQEMSGEWMSLVQAGAQRSVERLTAILQARSPGDFVTAHSSFVRGNFENLIDAQERVAQLSLRVMDEAAKRLTAEARPNPERFQLTPVA